MKKKMTYSLMHHMLNVCSRASHKMNKNHILFACFPKSASSFISRNVAKVVGYHFASLAFSPRFDNVLLTGEQNLSLISLIRNIHRNTVSQMHSPANAENIYLINNFEIKTIVLVRNIFDVVVSLRDHIINDPCRLQNAAIVPPGFASMGTNKQFEFIIRMIIPWYFKFYVSWFLVEKAQISSILWLTYEEMISDQYGFFRRIFDYCRIDPPVDWQSYIHVNNQPLGRMNKGIIGRGRVLTDKQRGDILSLSQFYQGIDFSRIGIGADLGGL